MSQPLSGSLNRRNLIGAAGVAGAAGAVLATGGLGDANGAATPAAMPGGTPGATPENEFGEIVVAATGLQNPRGFTWGPDGDLYVALAGSGGTQITTSDDASPEDQVVGPTLTGASASVVRIVDGCGEPVVTGLPSTQDPYGDVQGPVGVGFLNDDLYILQDATGGYEAVGPDFPNGLYVRTPDGSVRLVCDLTTYVAIDPASNLYHVLELGEPFAMVPWNGGFLVIDANQGLVLQVATSGTVSVLADVSKGHPVPTAIALAPDGGAYVGFLTAAPHEDGTSKVVKVEPNGMVRDFWTGLTTVTGLAVTPDGTLYALEMATGNHIDSEPNMFPNTGRLVRQTGPASLEVVVEGLDFPISMALGPDNGLYVAMPAIATDGELGGIVRIDPTLAGPVTMPTGLFANSPCAGAPVTGATPASQAATPATDANVTGNDTAAAATPDAISDNPGAKQGIASLAVQIQGNAFNPAQVQVTVGAIVAWTNLDSTAHSVTATDGSFDSGSLDQGEEWVHAFDTAGTFAYTSSSDPSMQGTVVVGQ